MRQDLRQIMLQQFKAITLNYKTAPVEIREAVALEDQGARELMIQLRDIGSPTELLILSTCNRTEVYYSSERDLSHEIIHLLALRTAKFSYAELQPHFQVINDSDAAGRWLFEVALGLESQILGDLQIINQVKKAYQRTADLHLAGPYLHRLLHTIFFTNKRVVQETCFRDGAASIAYAAVEMAESLLTNIADPRVLVVGVGEMGADACKNLENIGIRNVTICNRTLAKAEKLAAETGYAVTPFENIWEAVAEADLILSSISVPEPYFTPEKLRAIGVPSHKFFIDLSVPRSVDEACESIPGVLVFNIDQIRNSTEKVQEERLRAIPQVRNIMETALNEFSDWSRDMVVSPAIQKFKNALESIRLEELSRNKGLTEAESELIDKVTRNLMQKIIKVPVLQLKAACRRGDAENLVEVLQDLFNLENVTQPNNSHSIR